jgi:hypothetical protein
MTSSNHSPATECLVGTAHLSKAGAQQAAPHTANNVKAEIQTG